MRIDHRIEIEGGGRSEGFGGVDFEAVVVGGGEEGEGVEGVEGEMRDPEFMGRRGFVGFDRWMACIAFQRIFRALEIPEVYRGGSTA